MPIPIWDFNNEININCSNYLSKEFCLKNCLIPVKIQGDKLYISMKNPRDNEVIEQIRLITKLQVVVLAGEEEEIKLAIGSSYAKNSMKETVDSLRLKNKNLRYKRDNLKESINEDTPIVKLTTFIINQALIKGASDIHIEPGKNMVAIRYRCDGVLFEIFKLPQDIYSAIVTRIKVMASMDISEKRIPQDGKLSYQCGEGIYDVRVSSLPTIYGEKIVMRLLYKSEEKLDLGNLGFEEDNLKVIKNALKKSYGMILVTGPTGSGKSTTLYAMLMEINSREKNITTIEDPVEIAMDNINQVNVNNKAGITFASGLRSILRQDPDVIMVGEIRDEETAAIAVRAAITGHLVLSTLHTNDAVGAINRLVEMGVPKYLLADALIAVISQRLVRKICNNCKINYSPSVEEKEIFKDFEGPFYKGCGCPNCNHSGYRGRASVSEVFYIKENYREMILRDSREENLRKILKKDGMNSLWENGRKMVEKGITTIEEIVKLSKEDILL